MFSIEIIQYRITPAARECYISLCRLSDRLEFGETLQDLNTGIYAYSFLGYKCVPRTLTSISRAILCRNLSLRTKLRHLDEDFLPTNS